MYYLIKNPELKTILLKLVLAQIILASLIFLVVKYELAVMNRAITAQNIALTGQILSRRPELEDELVRFITQEADQAEIFKGKQILKKYGYQEELLISAQPVLQNLAFSFPIKVAIIIFIFIFPIALLVFFNYQKMYQQINQVSLAAERVVDGDFKTVFPHEREGEFGILGHNFNMMANRLKLSLEKLNQDKDFLQTMLSDISHQLKTPLSSLLTMNELLLAGKVAPADQRDFFEKSHSQLVRMEWLVTNLLKMARLEAGNIVFKSQRLLLAGVIEKALSPLQVNLEQKQQQIQIKGNVDEVSFRGDQDWTAEALTNIIKNCSEHTGEGGKIQIELSETPLFSRISISDNGEGIERRDLPHIFKRFYKGSNSVKTESIGIGLALTKLIIESQNGDITVSSVKGKGTRFLVTFFKGII